MDLQIILGNQLFPIKYYKDSAKNIYMCEDIDLCNHFKYHKHKLIFFLTSMRQYKEELEKKDKNVIYKKLTDRPQFFDELLKIIKKKKVEKLCLFEIEDKFFEKKIFEFAKKNKVEITISKTPMFLVSRDEFRDYNKEHKKPFMKTFYEKVRRNTGVLMEESSPVGGKFSFDEANRKKIPKKHEVLQNPIEVKKSKIIEDVKAVINKHFADHPGSVDNFWIETDRRGALTTYNNFLDKKFKYFGDYEDAIDERDPFLYHTVISPYLNIGFITPEEAVDKALKKEDIPINSKEGLIRQLIGWREFMRGIYQEYSQKQESLNFFNHKRKLTSAWYEGTTGILPLDKAIKKTLTYGYCHHIERLMIISNIMLLSNIHPQEVYKWFMEMFVDSSDWVMGPNVFGMAQFSDGGIFATKPYIAGSNYILKMSHYKKGDWCELLDGLYWNFIDEKREFLSKNYRMKMMVSLYEKMDTEKKKMHKKNALKFIEEKTQKA